MSGEILQSKEGPQPIGFEAQNAPSRNARSVLPHGPEGVQARDIIDGGLGEDAGGEGLIRWVNTGGKNYV